MVKGDRREGTVTRTPRGYEQDLELVMGNDPIRAILELVTNSDDAYRALLDGTRRKITIETERRRRAADIIRVKDRAGSMTRAQAEERLGQEGGRTSGFELGQDRRGLLGRGAKDIVHFGPVQWDLNHTDGEHSVFRLLYDQAPLGKWESESQGRSDPRSRGTTVTLELQQRFSLPNHDNIVKYLTRHFGMRLTLLDRRNREVRLIDRGQDRNTRLTYESPKGTALAQDERISIPGYPGEYVTLTLFRSDQSLYDGMDKPYWRHSLLITSGRASYDVYAGKFSREPWAPHLERLFGSVDAPSINDLIREYDDRRDHNEDPGPKNPVSLLKRDRTGLVGRNEHPFLGALYSADEEFLQPHLERMRQETGTGGASPVNEDTRRRNRNLASLLGRLLEEEETSVDGGDGKGGTLPPVGLSVIPSSRRVEPMQPGSVTVRYRHDPETPIVDLPPVAAISISDDDGTFREFPMELLERNGYYSRSQSAGSREVGALSELTASFFGEEASCIVEWERREVRPIDILAFEHARYALKEGVNRDIRLLVPWNVVSQHDLIPTVSINGDSTVSIVRSASVPAQDSRYDCASSTITVMGRGVGSTAFLRAAIGNFEANAILTVNASGVSGIRVKYQELDIPQRAILEDSTLIVNAADPTIARYLGKRKDHWPGQDDLHFRTMLAEVVTYTLARHVIQNRHQQERSDSYRLFYEHMELVASWLPRVHRVLVPTAELTPLR